MPRALGIVLALVAVASAAIASAASDGVGMRRMAVLAPERDGMLDATV
jgi:hypothetical protein